MDGVCYIFFAIIIFVVWVITTASSVIVKQSKKNRIRVVLIRLRNTIWDIMGLVVDQENFEAGTWSARIIWSSFNIVCFVLIFGYFWNLMSTEQSVEKKPPVVNSLQDLLYDKRFSHMYPLIFKTLFLYNVLATVPPSSDEGKLFQRILSTNKSIFEFDPSKKESTEASVQVMMADAVSGKSAFLSMAWALEIYVLLLPKTIDDFDPKILVLNNAKQTFLRGLLSIFYSKQINPHMRVYIEHR